MQAPDLAATTATASTTLAEPAIVSLATSSMLAPVASAPIRPPRFAALDFETADYGRDSACALSIVVVENDCILNTWTHLIRPPRREFVFTYIHGISWNHVHRQPTFSELWPEMAQQLTGVDFIAAHNASFDRSVLSACCAGAAIVPLPTPFVCTVKVARAVWNLYPTSLAHVCGHLRIPLRHHDAESDARACARILLEARGRGHGYDLLLKLHALKPARKPRRAPAS